MKKWIYSIIVGLFILSGCNTDKATPAQQTTDSETHDGHTHTNGDLREETANKDTLPTFLDGADENIQLTYQVAAYATDILEYMPCYCGCGESVGHRNNLDCFIHEIREDGSIVWDDHGTRCTVCLEIALQSAKMVQDGMDLKEIRNAIDEQYKEGYATPTDTKIPA